MAAPQVSSIPQDMRCEVEELLARYETEPAHTRHVAFIALQLLDGLSEPGSMGTGCRCLLEAASLLHDIGWHTAPDGKAHHKASAQLIRVFPWQSIELSAVQEIALIARYHRKSIPSAEHPEFASLPRDRQRRVEWLAGLLRLADGLDRTHRQRVESARPRKNSDGSFSVEVVGLGAMVAEVAGANRKKDLLERCLGTTVHLAVQQTPS